MCKVTVFRNFNIVAEQSTIELVASQIINGRCRDEVINVRHLLATGDLKGYEAAKKALLAFTACGMFDGGRRMPFLVLYSGLIVLDWDKLSPEEVVRVKRVLCSCKYVMLCFISPSGNGVKAIIRVSTGPENHLTTYLSAQRFFSKLTGVAIDGSGKDITRLCFMSWDPEGYFNKHAEVFDPNEEHEVTGFDAGESLDAGAEEGETFNESAGDGALQDGDKPGIGNTTGNVNNEGNDPISRDPISSGDTMKIYRRCLKFLKRKTNFIAGQRNIFIFRLALELRKAGLPEETALFLIRLDFNYQEGEVVASVKSAYRFDLNQENVVDEYYSRKESGVGPPIDGELNPDPVSPDDVSIPNEKPAETYRSKPAQYLCGFPNLAEMDRLYYKFKKQTPPAAVPEGENPPSPNQTLYEQRVVEEMISTLFEIRYNVVKGRIEWRIRKTRKCFQKMEDHHENSIYRWLVLHYQFMPVSVLHITMASNFAVFFNPFQTYLNGLRSWDGKTDYIGQLIATVKTEDDGYFGICTRKWFVAYAMSLFDDEVINHTILVLVGKQGVGKSRWLRKLMPEVLKEYLAPGASLADYKDIQLMMAECGLIIMDELEALNRRDLAMIKDLLTRAFFQVRRPYARTSTYLPHRASVCGSVNDEQILTDTTGTRRYLCSTVVSIDYEHNVSIDDCMAQAIALGRSGFNYWFDQEEIRVLTDKNEAYMLKSIEEELIEKWLQPLTREEWLTKNQFLSGLNYRLMTATDVTLFISTKGRIQVFNYTNSVVGRIMKKLNYKRICSDKKYLYMVRILTDDEVEKGRKNIDNTGQDIDPSNTPDIPENLDDQNRQDDELPF